VEITGEAYFEVVHRKNQPFKVKAGNREIVDLGTHFNINAYTDEPAMKTTLLEGSVAVGGLVLKPGEQASINGTGQASLIKEVDVDEVVAWKDGKFKFNSVDMEAVMRQVARWYDVEVEYRGKVSGTISGGISRDVNISELLHILELTKKVGFEIVGKKIIVIPI
jgi:ferric-dicitrate binding protein FerR (iron transport regulator)